VLSLLLTTVASKVFLKKIFLVLLQVKRVEIEGQIRQLQQMIRQQKESEEELVNRIGKLQDEKRMLQDRVANLQKNLAQAEQDKRELERAQIRVEKDKKALKTTLEKVIEL
jgi:rootletin